MPDYVSYQHLVFIIQFYTPYWTKLYINVQTNVIQIWTSSALTGSRNGQLCRCLHNLLITSSIAC